MGFEIDYDHIADEQAKRDKGIDDLRQYVGQERFSILGGIAMRATKYGELSFMCGFAGVEGFPVIALWDETRQELHSMTQ